MKITLISCEAQRPDKRAIVKSIVELSLEVNDSLATKLTEILLAGDPVDIEIEDKNSATALRTLRKLDIDYNIIE